MIADQQIGNPVQVDVRSKDRRFIVTKGTDKYLGPFYNERFWTRLAAHFRKPEFIRCLYDYLNTMDLAGVDWKKERRANLTKSYYQLAALYSPIEAVFFEELAQQMKHATRTGVLDWVPEPLPLDQHQGWGIDTKYKKMEIYRCMKQWAKSRGYYQKMEPTPKQFYNRIEVALDMPLRSAGLYDGATRYEFDPEVVHNHLVARKWVEDDTSDRGSPKTIEAFCVDLLSEIIDQSVIQSEQDAYWKNL